jgi:hypothetical protein
MVTCFACLPQKCRTVLLEGGHHRAVLAHLVSLVQLDIFRCLQRFLYLGQRIGRGMVSVLALKRKSACSLSGIFVRKHIHYPLQPTRDIIVRHYKRRTGTLLVQFVVLNTKFHQQRPKTRSQDPCRPACLYLPPTLLPTSFDVFPRVGCEIMQSRGSGLSRMLGAG